MNSIIPLIDHYGYIILFCALALELIAFPFPGQLIMTYCGFLVFQTKMSWLTSILSAALGAIFGITVSYYIGATLGYKFFNRYGRYIHLTPSKLVKASFWFERYGNKLLMISYFIPGVRHITGYFSGITKISFKAFAFNAYLGAFAWALTFISLGKFLGPNWENINLSSLYQFFYKIRDLLYGSI